MLVSVRLPDDLVARIDVVAGKGKRGEWLRGAAERALGGVEPPAEAVRVSSARDRQSGSVSGPAVGRSENAAKRVKPDAPVPVAGEPVFKRPDDGVLWRALRVKRGTAREMRDRLDWMEMRVERALSSLLSSGLVRVHEGLVEAVHPSR